MPLLESEETIKSVTQVYTRINKLKSKRKLNSNFIIRKQLHKNGQGVKNQ